MLSSSTLMKMGFEKQAHIVGRKLRENQEKQIKKAAYGWMELGATVNHSFYERAETNIFTEDEVKQALKDLGVDFENLPGKKWYQFWLNNNDVKLVNAMRALA
jgi:hypothetical protein